jgi:putative SOS response-associated peptidase YedK
LINARVETLAQKPAWRAAFGKRRAIIPASGYYEWSPREHDAKIRKQPYYLHAPDDGPLAFAGLYEFWRDHSKTDDDPDRWLLSTTIITADATGPSGEIHDRTPLILPEDRISAWLDPARTEPEHIYEVLDGIRMQPLHVRPVSTRVNRVANDGPDLIEPVDLTHPDEPLQLTLTRPGRVKLAPEFHLAPGTQASRGNH